MSILTVIIVFAVVAVALLIVKFLGRYLEADPWMVKVAYVAIIVIAAVYLMRGLGVFSALSSIRI